MRSRITTFITIIYTVFFSGNMHSQNAVPDTSFNPGTGFNNSVYSIALQPDGKILVGGYFTEFNGQAQKDIARLNANGTLDTSLNIGTGFSVNGTGNVLTLALQTDGKILVGGSFYNFNGNARNRIVRLNLDGSLDNSFNIGTGFSATVNTFTLQPDGKILVGGSFHQYNGQDQKLIARLNTDGSLDTTFTGSAYWVYENIYTIAVQQDGKIIVGGNFTMFNNQYVNRIVRLNADGSIDSTFNIGSGFSGGGSSVNSVALQSDGKIIAAGTFTKYNGQTRNRIVRLNTDGTLDTTFTIGSGFNGSFIINNVLVQPDGKILVGGSFTTFNGQTRNNFLRLNANGTLDTTFSIGTGFNDSVQSMVLQPNGKILAAGIFSQYNAQTWNRITRLEEGFLSTKEFDKTTDIKIYPNPVKDILHFDGQIHRIIITDLSGKLLSTKNKVIQADLSHLPTGIYNLIMEDENGRKEMRKIIKE